MMTNWQDIAGHYGTLSLLGRVDEALMNVGLTADTLHWSELAPLDQFHVRGLAATKELAAQLQIHSGATLLDVGSGLGGPARFLAANYDCQVIGIDLSQAFVDVANTLAERAGLAVSEVPHKPSRQGGELLDANHGRRTKLGFGAFPRFSISRLHGGCSILRQRTSLALGVGSSMSSEDPAAVAHAWSDLIGQLADRIAADAISFNVP